MNFINRAYAMLPPEDWSENKIECGIHGKILYQWKISEAECENYWLTIVRDENYKYYHIATATPKDFYQKFHESPDGKGAVTVTHEACPQSSKIPLNNEDFYYFTIRKFYVQYDFAIETNTGSTNTWEKLPTCSWNLIDQAPVKKTESEEIQTKYNINHEINIFSHKLHIMEDNIFLGYFVLFFSIFGFIICLLCLKLIPYLNNFRHKK